MGLNLSNNIYSNAFSETSVLALFMIVCKQQKTQKDTPFFSKLLLITVERFCDVLFHQPQFVID